MINKIKSTSKQLLKGTKPIAVQLFDKIVVYMINRRKKWVALNNMTNSELRKLGRDYTDYKSQDISRHRLLVYLFDNLRYEQINN